MLNLNLNCFGNKMLIVLWFLGDILQISFCRRVAHPVTTSWNLLIFSRIGFQNIVGVLSLSNWHEFFQMEVYVKFQASSKPKKKKKNCMNLPLNLRILSSCWLVNWWQKYYFIFHITCLHKIINKDSFTWFLETFTNVKTSIKAY